VSGLLIAAPLRIEAALISSAAPRARVRKTGMGTERARNAARALAGEGADGVLVLGFCGGLDATSVPGEVIVAEEVYAASDEGHSPAERLACAGAPELASMLQDGGMRARRGKIVCVSRLAVGERRAQLHGAGAIAVDMESVWLAPAAAGRPFAVVRIVLDSPTHELLRPQAAVGAVRAARALRRVAAALHEWAPGD
jgi:4-hydroxy-3-methylbut-2-en-1-yl diphosphate reductase